MTRKPSSSARGVGWQHSKDRRRLIATLVDGTPCCYCGGPMYRSDADRDLKDQLRLEADHGQPRVLGGTKADRLAHARCNRSAGATLGNRLRGARRHGQRLPSRTSREWGTRLPNW